MGWRHYSPPQSRIGASLIPSHLVAQTLRNKGHRLEHQNQGPDPLGQTDVGLGSGSAASCVTLVERLNFSELPPL